MASTKTAPTRYTSEQIAANNRAVALMGRFEYVEAGAIFEELAAQHPDSITALINLALARLNETQSGDEVLPPLQKALQLDPDHPIVNYCVGLAFQHGAHFDEARPFLEKAYEADPADPYTVYLLGEGLEDSSPDEALQRYGEVTSIDPYFKNAYYRSSTLLRFAKKMDEAKACLVKHSALGECPLAHTFDYKYTQMGPKAMAIPIDQPVDPVDPPQGDVFAAKRLLTAESTAIAPDVPTNVTTCDVNGDGRGDLFFAGMPTKDAGGVNTILLQQADGTFHPAPEHPLAAVTLVNAVAWGDFDNDGFTDAYLCRKGPNQLWRQTSEGVWEDVTETTKTAGEDLNSVDVAAVDADHDGDLDLMVVNEEGPNELWNNNRDGTYQPIAVTSKIAGGDQPSRAVLPADLDRDGDLDLLVLNAAPPHQAFRNELPWKYEPLESMADLCQSDIAAAVAGDVDADGMVEIYVTGSDGVSQWKLGDGGAWQKKNLDVGSDAENPATRIALADVQGDGRLDLVVGGAAWQVTVVPDAVMKNQTARVLARAEGTPLLTWAVATLDGSQGPSIVGVSREEGPVAWGPGPGRWPYATFSLAGKPKGGSRYRSNVSAIGARVQMRTGTQWAVAAQMRSDSGPGQSLQPLAVGLGDHASADFVRIAWPDGVTQVEMDLKPGQHAIEEVDRMPSSCPVLFTWDGERYSFVSDLLAGGGLGYLIAPGEYANSDPSENFLLPPGALAARDGRYCLKLTEPMEELTYLDRAGLVAYDLPPGWHVTLDERLATNPPWPTGEPRFYRDVLPVIRASNERGEVVTAEIREVDFLAAPVGALDARFVGLLAGEHGLTLEFDQSLDQGSGEPLLVADGWVEFPYSQTAFAAWQAGVAAQAPTLEARDKAGQWHVLHARFGYPGGMPRQMSVPLTNLPVGCKALRLRTNQEIYWDRLAVVDAKPCPEARKQVLRMEEALVLECGFMPRSLRNQQRPTFEYCERVPFGDTRDPRGFYTAFGPAAELVRYADNGLAIFGPGEQIHLEFAEPSDPCPPNWNRRWVLELVGWCKDMDFYTRDGRTVLPLPGNRTSQDVPDAVHAQYNTRYQDGRVAGGG